MKLLWLFNHRVVKGALTMKLLWLFNHKVVKGVLTMKLLWRFKRCFNHEVTMVI